MFKKFFSCIHRIGWRFFGQYIPRWQQHLDNYCLSNSQKYLWCEMIMDNFDIIKSYGSLSRQIEHEIRGTNISSQIVNIIINHYKKQGNIFSFCIQLFGSYLKLKYSDIINPSKNTFNKLLKDYQQYMSLLVQLLVIYYKLQDRQILGQKLFYNYTLPSLIINFFFENQDISNTIHYIIKQVYKQFIQKIQFNSQKYLSMDISQFQIYDKLQLNQRTLKFYNIHYNLNNLRSYTGAIQIVKQFIRVVSPIQKISLFQGLQKQIQSTVHSFYKQYNIKDQQIQIDYQNMISIILYIVLQANQPSLYAHYLLITHFGPPKKSKNNDCNYQNFNTVLEMIQKGVISSPGKKQGDFNSLKNIEVSSYFDEVCNFQL